MNFLKITLSVLFCLIFGITSSYCQVIKEPEFIGESIMLITDSSYISLDKEIGDFTSGISWSANSFDALTLEVSGNKAQSRVLSSAPIQLIVRAVDNNSDPLSIVRIYKLKVKSKKRSVLISENNAGTLMKSRTNSKDEVRFLGKKYGENSYLLTLPALPVGEYGMIVSNPNSKDEKRVVVSCFGVDK